MGLNMRVISQLIEARDFANGDLGLGQGIKLFVSGVSPKCLAKSAKYPLSLLLLSGELIRYQVFSSQRAA